MKYVKNLVKILLLAQCLLLFCTCNKKEETTEIETTEQNELNLADFVKCPFNEEFKSNTNIEKYVLKKFGKPDEVIKVRGPLDDTTGADIIIDHIELRYSEKYSFVIYRGISRKFEIFSRIYMYKFIDLKYGISEKTSIRNIENLYGNPESVKKRPRTKDRPYSFTDYRYSYSSDDSHEYFLYFGFLEGRLHSIEIITNICF